MIWIPALAAWYAMKVNQMEWERQHANGTGSVNASASLERRHQPLFHCEQIETQCRELGVYLESQQGNGILDCEQIVKHGRSCLDCFKDGGALRDDLEVLLMNCQDGEAAQT